MTFAQHSITARRAVALCALACAAQAAFAQADPTRPSAAWLASRTAPKEPAGEAAAASDSQIVVTRAGKAFVMVDGKVVRPGETYNGARLVRIGEAGAVWQRGDDPESAATSEAIVKTAVKADGKPASKKQKRNANGGESR
jgi:hypothetical protein